MPTTPTANISPEYPPIARSPSRLPEYDPQSTPSSPAPPPPAHPTPHLSPPQVVPTTRPSKRRRNMPPERASSASDASSQSGIADETEPEPTPLSERSGPLATAPPKKKRTRTLTTPHQSAVLHALLAKSRFPTTAMREEVGRQIGLSARKVQIWFQNQRQKARRPQTDSAPLTRPPQFGPFPIMTTAGPSSASYPSPSSGAPASDASHSAPSSAQSVRDSAASLDSNPILSGPGMCHWSPSSYQRRTRSADDRESSRRPPTSTPETPFGNSQHHRLSQGISARDSRGSTRGLSPHPTQSKHVETPPHFSGVLPPITVHALEPRSSTEPYVSAMPSFPPQPPPHTFVNTVQHHNSSARPTLEQGIPVRPSIPPPFVLQPQPQWDPQTFTPYTRPQFATWLQPSGSPLSSARTTVSPVGAHDRVTHTHSPDVSRRRHAYRSLGESHPASQHIIPPPFPQNQQFSASAPSSRASVSREGHTRSDDELREE